MTPVFKKSDGGSLVGRTKISSNINWVQKKARKCEKAPEIIFGV